ncbi:MAG: protease inhibitor I42 family protein [Rhodocyclaceae bacterium]
MRGLLGAALAAAMLAGCSLMPSSSDSGAIPGAGLVRLNDADSGKDIFVRTGQTIEIMLAANRSTGFSWSMVADASTIVTTAGQPTYTDNKGQSIGRGGIETWRFKANRQGTQTLRFEYRRAADKNALPSRTAAFNIRVN